MLFDLQKDPYEMENLAELPAHKETLETLRNQVAEHIRNTKDLGFFPPNLREQEGVSLYEWVRDSQFPLEELYAVVETASEGLVENAPKLTKQLMSDHPAIRFWAASGFTTVGALGHKLALPESLEMLCQDTCPSVAVAAAEALCYHGQEEHGVRTLVALIQQNELLACSALEALAKNRGVTEAIKSHIPDLRKMAVGKGPQTFYVRSILVECGINTPWDLSKNGEWVLGK